MKRLLIKNIPTIHTLVEFINNEKIKKVDIQDILNEYGEIKLLYWGEKL